MFLQLKYGYQLFNYLNQGFIMQKELLNLIQQALEIDYDINLSTKISDIEEWDSLGHLSVLSALSKSSNGESDDIDLTSINEVKDIFELLNKNNILLK